MEYNYNNKLYASEIDYNKVTGTFPVTYNDSIPFVPCPPVSSSGSIYNNVNTYTTSSVSSVSSVPVQSYQNNYTTSNYVTNTTSSVSSVPIESYQNNYTINTYGTNNYIDYGSSNNIGTTTSSSSYGNYIPTLPKRNTVSGFQTSYQTNITKNIVPTTNQFPVIKSKAKYNTHTFDADYYNTNINVSSGESFNLNQPMNIPNLRSSLKNLKETMDAYLYSGYDDNANYILQPQRTLVKSNSVSHY